jgi:TfoX/Sxy family transcriptional regulator of competence genes
MKKAKNKSDHDAVIIEQYEKLISKLPNVERKGATLPYTSLNGHMFSFINKAGTLGLRLDETDREAFMKKYNTGNCVEHGAIMKEYVSVPEKIFMNQREIQLYFAKSLEYVKKMKPKVIAKKK